MGNMIRRRKKINRRLPSPILKPFPRKRRNGAEDGKNAERRHWEGQCHTGGDRLPLRGVWGGFFYSDIFPVDIAMTAAAATMSMTATAEVSCFVKMDLSRSSG